VQVHNGLRFETDGYSVTGGTISLAGASSANNTITVTTGTATINSTLAGSTGLTKSGSGTLRLGGSNTFTGGTTLSTGTLRITSSGALGSGSLTQSDATSVFTIDTTGTISNTMSLYNVLALQSATLSGAITINNATFDVESGDTLTLSGGVGGTGGVTKNGTGALVLSGSNTYSGATVVNAGTLNAAHANALGTNASVTVNGGSLLVSSDDAINSKNLILASTASGNGTAASLAFSGTYNGTAGTLTLNQNSIIDLGEGSVVIRFSDIVWGGSTTLGIYNWTGTTLWGGGDGNNTDQFYIDSSLDAGELNRISFYSGLDNSSFVGTGYQLSGGSFNNEVIPVPEPETYATALLLLLGLGLYWHRRQKSGRLM
jgi:autotransporter-associated beta strand protein